MGFDFKGLSKYFLQVLWGVSCVCGFDICLKVINYDVKYFPVHFEIPFSRIESDGNEES